MTFNYPYAPAEKQSALRLLQKYDIKWVARRYKCTIYTIYRWKRQYDGTIQSLYNKSHRPITPHPNAHTPEEEQFIAETYRSCPNIGLTELFGILRTKYAYSRHPVSLYRWLCKHNFKIRQKKIPKYKPKDYYTPKDLGIKWQMDVKVVPKRAYTYDVPYEQDFYQYTMIDEASRERFLYPYQEVRADMTVDFVKRAIAYFGYVPRSIQTDNGHEFTYNQKTDRVHSFDRLCDRLGIAHLLIRPRTPRHNGKVERSHQNDERRFYQHLKFCDLDDLKQQMLKYVTRSNSIPNRMLTSLDGKTKWMSPFMKRKELLGVSKNPFIRSPF